MYSDIYVSEKHGASVVTVEVKIEAARSSEVPVSSYKATWYHNEEQPV
jgi:hypothetical protein